MLDCEDAVRLLSVSLRFSLLAIDTNVSSFSFGIKIPFEFHYLASARRGVQTTDESISLS